MRYNIVMTQSHRLRLWLALALALAFIVAVALWLCGTLPGSDRSPLPTPMISEESPLPTPTPLIVASSPPSSWTNGGAALLWVALGILLALSIAFLILRWYHHAA
ncbi:MAG: hypothetical protein SXV54_13490 [Chloroflexota bacterium]|nr:hypothetical protein [Chloroflexota bacterium]